MVVRNRRTFIFKWAYRLRRYAEYYYQFFAFRSQDTRFCVLWKERYACLDDKTETTAFNQPHPYTVAWAARILQRINPEVCIDISSCILFNAIVSAFVPVKFYDYRPVNIKLSNLISGAADLLQLPFAANSVQTLSCLHVLEHVGLGRYGDPLDSEGDLKAIAELKRVIAPGGNLILTVPIGQPKVIFNAERIYSYAQIMRYFNEFELKEFSLIPDSGGLRTGATEAMCNIQDYGCGCFWLVKNGVASSALK